MRISHKIILVVSEDSAAKQILFGIDATLAENIVTSYLHQNSGTIKIAASATEQVPFGDVDSVKGCYLRFDKDVKIKLNGSADEIQIRKSGTGDVAKFFIEADLTQIDIIGDGTDVTNGVYCVWGDTAP